jgi:hypothetical protein
MSHKPAKTPILTARNGVFTLSMPGTSRKLLLNAEELMLLRSLIDQELSNA